MPIDMACCSDTVNSAISLWTELEVIDEDDDMYTYQTIETGSLYYNHHNNSKNQLYHHASKGVVPPCLKKSTFVASASSSSQQRATTTATALSHSHVDPALKWQEEAYWMSFHSAVKSFSDKHHNRPNSSNASVTLSLSRVQSIDEDLVLDEDDLLSYGMMSQNQPTTMTTINNHNNNNSSSSNNNHNDCDNNSYYIDDLPPCLPRTVVTPSASTTTTNSHTGDNMSVGSGHSRSSRYSRTKPTATAAPEPPLPPPPELPKLSLAIPPITDFDAVRRSLDELVAEAEEEEMVVTSTTGRGAGTAVSAPDTSSMEWRNSSYSGISSSSSSPTAEDVKQLRRRMKQLADHASAVIQGATGSEQYLAQGGIAGANPDFTAIREGLQELATAEEQAASLKNLLGGGGSNHSNSSSNTITYKEDYCTMVPPGKFKSDWIVSQSLAGPTAEDLKALRWRMKLLAEHAAAVIKGAKDADKYVVGSLLK